MPAEPPHSARALPSGNVWRTGEEIFLETEPLFLIKTRLFRPRRPAIPRRVHEFSAIGHVEPDATAARAFGGEKNKEEIDLRVSELELFVVASSTNHGEHVCSPRRHYFQGIPSGPRDVSSRAKMSQTSPVVVPCLSDRTVRAPLPLPAAALFFNGLAIVASRDGAIKRAIASKWLSPGSPAASGTAERTRTADTFPG